MAEIPLKYWKFENKLKIAVFANLTLESTTVAKLVVAKESAITLTFDKGPKDVKSVTVDAEGKFGVDAVKDKDKQSIEAVDSYLDGKGVTIQPTYKDIPKARNGR